VSFWIIIAVVLLGYTLLASIYLALDGFVYLPKQREIIEYPAFWYPLIIAIIFFVAWMTGDFGRGEISPLPWEAFMDTKDGVFWSIFVASMVIIADLWLLWIPANIWINDQKVKISKENSDSLFFMARVINLLVGLLLMTENNPAIKLLGIFYGVEGVEP